MRTGSNSRAISLVISTIILAATSITVCFASANWIQGIATKYTEFEKIEMRLATCYKDTVSNWWRIDIELENSGPAAVTLNGVFVNDITVTKYGVTCVPADETGTNLPTQTSIEVGQMGMVTIFIGTSYPKATKPFSSGTSVNIGIRSAGGTIYTRLVQLV